MSIPTRIRKFRPLTALAAGLTGLALSAGAAAAQKPYGLATLPAGTLNYTTASAIAKVLKEKAGMNVLVQPTAGDAVILPMVDRNEAEIGISNILEVADAVSGAAKIGKQPHLRLIGVPHTFRGTFWVRKDSPMKTIADLKGKKVPLGYSAMLTIDRLARAILATGGLAEKDVSPILVPNVVRGAEAFSSGTADMFFFAFGAPKVREVDATVGGIRALEIPASGLPEAKKIFSYGYLTKAVPNPFFVGVTHPMDVYTWDNLLVTNDKVPNNVVYKIIDTLVNNTSDLVAVQPALRGFSAQNLYTAYDLPYHPGALKYFKDHNIKAKAIR
jgi:TRAP transporter TAXI family solute receptor